jgi:tetratricopeptide (TPR) repeat protein
MVEGTMRAILVGVVGAAALASAAEAQSFRTEFGRCSDVTLEAQARIAACTAGLDLAPSEADRGMVLFYASDARLGAGDFSGAIADADRAAALLGLNRDVLNAQCWTRAVANRELDRARIACDASLAVELQPAVLDSRGLVNLREGKWQAAWEDYDAAFAADPTLTVSLYGRGLAAIALGKVRDGEADLRRSATAAAEFAGYGLTPAMMKGHAEALAVSAAAN